MAANSEGLADELVAVANFAVRWLRGTRPGPLHGWHLEAWPGMFSRRVASEDEAGQQVPAPADGAERVVIGSGVFWNVPADASGVVPGVWYQWEGDRELVATHTDDARIRILFTLTPKPIPGVWFSWIGDRRVAPGLLRRPGRHRAEAWQRVLGTARWGAIVISADGYPELRALQVGRAQGWLTDTETLTALQAALFQRRLAAGRPDQSTLIYLAASQLLIDARNRRHTPAYPLRRTYLYRIIRKEYRSPTLVPLTQRGDEDEPEQAVVDGEGSAEVSARRFPRTLVASDQQSSRSERSVRRLAMELARADGHDGLSSLYPQERETYRTRAIKELDRRRRLSDLRRLIRRQLAEAGVSRTTRAIELFVARHKDEPPEQFWDSVTRYLKRRGAGF